MVPTPHRREEEEKQGGSVYKRVWVPHWALGITIGVSSDWQGKDQSLLPRLWHSSDHPPFQWKRSASEPLLMLFPLPGMPFPSPPTSRSPFKTRLLQESSLSPLPHLLFFTENNPYMPSAEWEDRKITILSFISYAALDKACHLCLHFLAHNYFKVGGEGDDRGWGGWMASTIQWTWVWVKSGSWWWTGRPGVLQSMGSQRVRYNWATELKWTDYTLQTPFTFIILVPYI